jgi:hypothetical protein
VRNPPRCLDRESDREIEKRVSNCIRKERYTIAMLGMAAESRRRHPLSGRVSRSRGRGPWSLLGIVLPCLSFFCFTHTASPWSLLPSSSSLSSKKRFFASSCHLSMIGPMDEQQHPTSNSETSNAPRTWVQKPGWPPRSSRTVDDGASPSFSSQELLEQSRKRRQQQQQHQERRMIMRRQKTKPMPVTGYDAGAIEEYYDMRPLEVGWRLNSLGFPLLGTYGQFCSK